MTGRRDTVDLDHIKVGYYTNPAISSPRPAPESIVADVR